MKEYKVTFTGRNATVTTTVVINPEEHDAQDWAKYHDWIVQQDAIRQVYREYGWDVAFLKCEVEAAVAR